MAADVAVVGARGTLGSRLVRQFSASAVDFRIADGAPEVGDLEAVADADVVINVGGPRVRPGLRRLDYMREHVGVARAILSAMHEGAHLIHVSSTAVFGASPTLLEAASEERPSHFPMPHYAVAKLAAENFVRTTAPLRGVRTTILRPSTVYGPGIESILDSLVRLRRRGINLTFFPRRVRLHMAHIDLVMEVIHRAMDRPQGPAPLLVVDPFLVSIAELARPAKRTISVPVPLSSLAGMRTALLRAGLGWTPASLDTLAFLAMDNVFDYAPTFSRLGIDTDAFTREKTFDPYWKEQA